MARQFGIITTTTGITGIVVNSLTTNNTAEIAEALRMPPSTVRTRLSRSRALLRKLLCQGG